MIYCIWCGNRHDSFLMHVCPDGATFVDRTHWSITGKQAPYLNKVPDPSPEDIHKEIEKYRRFGDSQKVDINWSSKDELFLTKDDYEFLKGLKINEDIYKEIEKYRRFDDAKKVDITWSSKDELFLSKDDYDFLKGLKIKP